MPQGVTGAPATFQRLMEKAVGDMNLLQVLVYLDDLIVFGATLEEHEERLLKVLDRLEEVGLKVSLDKCQICRDKVKYVGHIVSPDGVSTDPDKVEAVTKWPRPTDLKSLRSFLGFCGYYRRFVANYAAIVKPLTELTKGYPPVRKGKKPESVSDRTYYVESELFGSRWTDSCTEAFCKIIDCLTHAPVLAFADPTRPYVLHVDASLKGLGAVLNQVYPEGLRPVAFASRGLNAAEQKYHIHQLEFLSLKWAVVEKFHDYLYGVKFTVVTDNNPLTYVLTTGKLNATGHRWLAALATYDFEIKYRPGHTNIDADLLSRRGNDLPTEPWKHLSDVEVKGICNCIQLGDSIKAERLVDKLGAPAEAIPKLYVFATNIGMGQLEQFTRDDLRRAQDTDDVIGVVKNFVRANQWPVNLSKYPEEVMLMKRESEKLKIKDELLHRVVKDVAGNETFQLVLPDKFRIQVTKALHDDLGHLGTERTVSLIRDRFYWPRMAQMVENYVKNCGYCVSWKSHRTRAAPLHQITSGGPMELVCIDFLSLETDTAGFSNILVVTDHFSRYAQAYPTKDQKATTVARVLVETFFVHYGLPARIHSDQGRDFEGKVIQELLKCLGIRKSRTTPYHPQGDPQPERFNRTLLSMLGTLNTTQKRQWSRYVSQLVHAYNSTKSDATGYSPYFLMFGREARLPVDICFETEEEIVSHSQYVEGLKRDLKRAYELAEETATKVHMRNKKAYDKVIRHQTLTEGDRVLVENLGIRGKHKLQSRWNQLPHVVVNKYPDLPVYTIRPEGGMGRTRVLHRDHLLPIGQAVRIPEEKDPPSPVNRPMTRQQGGTRYAGGHRTQFSASQSQMDCEQDSETENEFEICCHGKDYCETLEKQIPETNENGTLDESEPGEIQPASMNLPDNITDLCDIVENFQDMEGTGGQERRPDTPRSERDNSVAGLEEQIEVNYPRRSQRKVKPVLKLTYDELGNTTDHPLTIVHKGIVIKIS